MKVNVKINCTPEEARAFFGLPDLRPMQQRLMGEIEERLRARLNAMNSGDRLSRRGCRPRCRASSRCSRSSRPSGSSSPTSPAARRNRTGRMSDREKPTDPEPYYEAHIFCCTNSRPAGHPRGCCAERAARACVTT